MGTREYMRQAAAWHLLVVVGVATTAKYDLTDPDADHSAEAIERDEAGDRAGALASFRAAVRFKPNDSEHWNNLGIFLRDDGDGALREAGKHFRAALEIDPQNEWAGQNLQDIHDTLLPTAGELMLEDDSSSNDEL